MDINSMVSMQLLSLRVALNWVPVIQIDYGYIGTIKILCSEGMTISLGQKILAIIKVRLNP